VDLLRPACGFIKPSPITLPPSILGKRADATAWALQNTKLGCWPAAAAELQRRSRLSMLSHIVGRALEAQRLHALRFQPIA
jgi:hypothetical protein